MSGPPHSQRRPSEQVDHRHATSDLDWILLKKSKIERRKSRESPEPVGRLGIFDLFYNQFAQVLAQLSLLITRVPMLSAKGPLVSKRDFAERCFSRLRAGW